MANRRPSTLLNNTREEILSSDLNRSQQLAWREVINRWLEQSRSQGWRNTATDAIQFQRGELLPQLLQVPTLTLGAGFDLDIGPGEALLPDVGGGSADEPNGIYFRWEADTVTLPGPDANLRIDVLIATPGETQADPQTRTILQNPTTGVTAPATVNKTINPTATLSVVSGAAAASNAAPPAVPAGSIALFAFIVPSGAASNADVEIIRGTNRPAIEVLPTFHGVMDDFTYRTETGQVLVNGAGGSAQAWIQAIIDGELIQGGAPQGLGNPNGVYQDSLNDPFGVAAGDFDTPYSIYLVGGRNAPNGRIVTATSNFEQNTDISPFLIVESLTPPDQNGHPSADINTPWGTVQRAALFVGYGWKVQNSTTRKVVRMGTDNWVHAMEGSVTTGNITSDWRAFNEVEGGGGGSRTPLPGASSTQTYNLNSAPPWPAASEMFGGAQRQAQVVSSLVTTGGDEIIAMEDTGGVVHQFDFLTIAAGIHNDFLRSQVQLGTGPIPFLTYRRGAAGAGLVSIEVVATAYTAPVRRLARQ